VAIGTARGWGVLTLETPTALVLPVATSFSICFHVSTWLCEWMMSRSPLGSLGKRSSLPGGPILATALCFARETE
jgi:hypothetical protein